MKDGENMITVAQLAEHLQVHPQTIYAWANNGTVPGVRIGAKGRTWRFYLSEVQEHLNGPSDPWVSSKKPRGRKRKP